ncbi:hypothetical protein D7X30_39950 [Corallococcus sp. AB011P]|uniref:nSTAND3 domain-containing NTPase n=1 Tax=Corallococcus sp. AB011P TaxID=2316735 RepID=UPI000EA1F880|nr:hypothetical protein [Corallococcus sp. AB011P]RKG49104.1 hypothetical protein D7X30_39950 [Corallococcus sp. AB011P]
MSDETVDPEDKLVGGAGGASLAGYEYQIDVSVWLALDLVLASKLTHELVLEPTTEEDIEADLKESEPGQVTSKTSLEDYRLVVQAKLRTGDAWTPSKIKALLKHGNVRESAAKRLEDPAVRYLLVTSAALNGKTQNLRVRRAGIWPKAADMPSEIQSELPPNSAGRVAIVGSQDEERLLTDIKRFLTESFRVPTARWEECRQALREGARARMRGAGGGRWIRAELEDVIRQHEGYIASSPELEYYVHPTSWPDLRAAMRQRHAALIIGQSGTGKTMATKKLYEELRKEIPGLSRVPIKYGPQQLRDDRTQPPVLYDIEDPWGRFDFDPRSRPWNDQLAQLFAAARHDWMIIATSRRDVAQSSGAYESVKPWMVNLEAEHYGPSERRRLYRTRIGALPHLLQGIARQHETLVLGELGTPLELQKFFDALPTLGANAPQGPTDLVHEAIRRAHQESIERTVIEQISERNDVRAAAVLWGLLKANDKLSQGSLRLIEEELAERDPQFEKGVSPLVDFFVAARNLRQSESAVTYYHPRVEAGIEQALRQARLTATRALRTLLDVLTSLEGPNDVWGTAAAVRLFANASSVPELKPSTSPSTQKKIDSWLASELATGDKTFEATLSLAAAAGSSNSNLSEAARFLLHRHSESFEDMYSWELSAHEDAWYARMRADPGVKLLVETFIRKVLPRTSVDFPTSFAVEAERIATDLTSAFLAAATRSVSYGMTQTGDVIAEGALNDLEGFESVIDKAVNELTPSEADRQQREELELAIINGEYSADYTQHLIETSNDEGYTASSFLGAYVDRVRATGMWERLDQHRHRGSLMRSWLQALAKDPALASDELASAFAAGYGSKHEEDLWRILTKAWAPRYVDTLVNRVRKGSPHRDVRIAALTCLVDRAPEHVPAIFRILMEQERQSRWVELAVELGQMRQARAYLDGEVVAAAAGELPPLAAEVSDAAFALQDEKAPTLSEPARKLIEGVLDVGEELRLFRVRMDLHVALDVADDVRWLLLNATELGNAVEALDAAIRHDMADEVRGALTHKFANVAAGALRAVAMPLPSPLPGNLLDLAKAKGSPVRRALVEILDVKPHPAHLPALMQLINDGWSRNGFYGGEEDYPIAQAAVSPLAKLGRLEAETAEQLYRVAIESRDSELRDKLFVLLVREGGSNLQERLFDLAVNPGRLTVRRAAASALLRGLDHVTWQVVARITPQFLETRVEAIASRLLLLLASKGELDAVVMAAATLAVNAKRRVLLLLAIRVLRDRDRPTAERIAGMLPKSHVTVAWALGSDIGEVKAQLFEDLGDPLSIEQVLDIMKPKKT